MPAIRRPLSNWMRGWIALTLVVWIIGAWWILTNIGLPSLSVTRDEACSYYFGTAPNDHLDYVRRCLADPLIEAEARERYFRIERELWAMIVGFWLLLPIVPGVVVLMVAIVWKARKAL